MGVESSSETCKITHKSIFMTNTIIMERSCVSLIACVKEAVDLFLRETPNLLDFNAHEQSMSHRIAFYLERRFADLNVDCEYNKHLSGAKELIVQENRYKHCSCASCHKRTAQHTEMAEVFFRPDIVVHERGSDSQNLVAIEIKKKDYCLFDQAKLMALTKLDGEYHYKLGVFACFPNGSPEYAFYADGAQLCR